jgi:hypothetical protein
MYPQKAVNGKFYNKTKMGKIRTRWEYVVGGTCQIQGICGWRRRTEDREE